jgi:hypothetical protein
MARVRCEVCGKLVDTQKNNYVFANGCHQHRKCPSQPQKLSEQDKIDRRNLTLAIESVVVKQLKVKKLTDAQWGKIQHQIKKLKDEGYSYQDQLYAFEWYFSKNNNYMGYGIISYIIEEALADREKQEKMAHREPDVDQEMFRQKILQKQREQNENIGVIKTNSKPIWL